MEIAAGWSESMKPRQLAALQRPLIKGDSASRRRQDDLFDAIQQACASGVLVHEKREYSIPLPAKSGLRVQRPGGRYVTLSPPASEPNTFPALERRVCAAPFADWLRKQDEEPSQYIAHWFKVRGVASGAQVLELTKPDVDVPQDATNDRWWSTWCTRRIAANTLPDGSTKRGRACERWTDGALNVLGLRFSTLKERELSDSAAKTSIASDLKTSVQALRIPLEKWAALQMQSNNQSEQKAS